MRVFFARDPGAANVVAAVFREAQGPKVLWGKDMARDVFRRLGLPFEDFNQQRIDRPLRSHDASLIHDFWNSSLSNATELVTGTTHFDDYTDRLLWKEAAARGVRSLAIFDQWIRSRERFETPEGNYYPYAVWTPDEAVAAFIKPHLPANTELSALSQPYLYDLLAGRWPELKKSREILAEIKRRSGTDFERLVILASEPQKKLRELGTQFKDVQEDESSLIEKFREALRASSWGAKTLLLVRPHPKQNSSDFAHLNVFTDEESSKWDLLRSADLVVGHKSMMLIEAALLGIPTLSVKINALAEDEDLVTARAGITFQSSEVSEISHWLDNSWKKDPLHSAKLAALLNLEKDWRLHWEGKET